MLSINTNVMSYNATNNLQRSYNSLADSINRLSSGMRINGAADDAAGLAVRELMRSDIAVLGQGIRNAGDAISLLQTMDGAASVIDEKLIRMKELAEQAATGTYSDSQRTIMNDEFAAMRDEIDRIAVATDFNGIKMLNADSTGTKQTLGATEDANGFAATTSAVTAFTDFAAGDHIIFSWTDSSGNSGIADLGAVTVGTTITSIVNGLNSATVMGTFDGTAAWTSGTGLVVTGASSGVSQLALTITDGDDASYQMSTSSTVGGTEGVDGRVKVHFGTGQDSTEDYYYLNKQDMSASGLSIDSLDITSTANAETALSAIDAAITEKDTGRAHFGAMINRLENTVTNLTIQQENLVAAESQISDVDVALEMTSFTNTQIKAQAAIAMLAQANGLPNMAMQLLGG